MISLSSISATRGAVARALLLGCCYFVACAVMVRFSRLDGGVAFVWIANALLLAPLLLIPRREWIWPVAICFAAGAAASTLFGIGFRWAPLLTLATVSESLIGATLLRRFGGKGDTPQSLREVMIFVAIAGGLAPAASGLLGAATVSLATGTGFWRNWLHWDLGHAIGAIAFTPIASLALSGNALRKLAAASVRCRIETGGLILLNIVTAALVFGQARYPLLFLPMLPLIVAAFRLGPIGAAASVSIIVAVGGYLTARGYGPILLIQGSVAEHVEFFQFYVVIAALLALPVSAELQRRAALFLALQESEARYRLIADRSGDIIINITPDGIIRYISPSIAVVAGHDPAALVGRPAESICAEEDRGTTAAAHAHALAEPDAIQTIEFRLRTTAGELIWCEAQMRGVVDDTGKVIGVVTASRDISRRKTLEHELTVAATTDPLTGLANRRSFAVGLEHRITQVRDGEGIGACAILDLDFFKEVNDRHGHDAGDRVLRAVAKAACDAVRGTDLVARLGGEEFGIVLWSAEMAAAEAVCERLRHRIAGMVVRSARGDPIMVTISIGLAAIVADADADGLLRAADAALYAAKSAGRNQLILAA